MEEKESNRRVVGISGSIMENSSISNSTFIGGNSDADVGIFDTKMKDTHLSGLNISDLKAESEILKSNNSENSKTRIILLKWWWKIAIPLLIGITLLAIQQKWFV